MKNIKVSVSLGNKEALLKELENLGKNIHLDFGDANKSLKELVDIVGDISKKLDGLSKGVKSTMGGIAKETKGASQSAKELGEELSSLKGKEVKVSVTVDSKGATKTVTDFKNSFGETAREVKKDGEILTQTVTYSYEKVEQKMAEFTNRVEKLNKSGVKVGDLARSLKTLTDAGMNVQTDKIEAFNNKLVEVESNLSKLQKFKTGELVKIDKDLLSGKISDKEAKQLKKTLDSINVRNLEAGMEKYNRQMQEALQHTKGVNDQTKALESEINKISKVIEASKSIASKSGNEQILNSKSFQDASDLLNKMEGQLKELQKTGKLVKVDDLTKTLNTSSKATAELNNQVKETSSGYRKVQTALDTMQTKLNLMKSTKILDDSYLDKLQKQLNETRSEIDKNGEAFSKFRLEFTKAGESEKQIKAITQSFEKLQAQMKRADDYEIVNTKEIEDAKQSIKELSDALDQLKKGESIDIGRIMGEAKVNTDALRNSVNGVARETKNLGSSFSDTLRNLGFYVDLGDIIRGVFEGLREGIEIVTELDTAMRDLRKVSSATAEELAKYPGVANEMAQSIGATTDQIIKATEYYSKLGYELQGASERAELATIFKNIGDFSSIDEASEALITIQKGFNDLGDGVEDMTRIMDVANEVGNNFTSTTKDISEGLRRSGNALSEANNTYEESVAIFVSANSSVQNAEKVGNALKTIAMRLRGMETELDECGVPASNLREEIKEITRQAGHMVDIMADENTFKSTYEILTELAEVYPLLTDKQRAYVQQIIAGKQQGNVFSGIMANMKEGADALTTALDSSGSAMREQEVYMDSIEGKSNKLKETAKGMWVELISSEMVKSGIDGLQVLIEKFGVVVDIVDNVVETFGGATTATMLLGTALALTFGKHLSVDDISDFVKKVYNCITAENLLTTTTHGLGTAIKGLFMSNPLGVIMVVATTLLTVFGNIKAKIEENKQAIREMNQEFIEADYVGNQKSADQLIQKYKDIYAELGTLKKGTEEYTQKEQELHSVIEQLTSIYPNLNQAIVENDGHKRLNLGTTKELLEMEKEMAKMKALDVVGEGGGTLNDLESLVGQTKKLKDGFEEGLKVKQEYFDKTGDSSYLADTLEKDSQALQDNIDKMKAKREAFILLDGNTGKYRDAIAILTAGLEDLGYTFEDTTDNADGMGDAIEDLKGTTDDATESMGAFHKSMQDWNLDGSIDYADQLIMNIMKDADDARTAVEALSNEFGKFEQPINLSAQAMEELNTNGVLSGETWEAILKSGNLELIAGLWLDGAEAQKYYTELNGELSQSVEDLSEATIIAAAQELGILEENAEAYAILVESKKEHAIAIAEQEKADKIAIAQQEVEEKYRYQLQHAENEAQAQAVREQQAKDFQERVSAIEAETSKTIEEINNGNLDTITGILEKETTEVQSANQKKAEAYQQDVQTHEQAQQTKTKNEQAFVNNSTSRYSSYVSGANTAYQTDVGNFRSAISQKTSALQGFQTALSNAAGAIQSFNSMTIRSYSGGSSGGNVAMSQSVDDAEFNAVAPMSAEGSSEGGEEGGVSPLAIPGGVQHTAGNFVGSTVGGIGGQLVSLASATSQLSQSTDKLTSSTKSYTSSVKSNTSATKENSKEIEIEYDRYYKLNDILEDHDNLLKQIEDAKDVATGEEYLELIKKENEVIAKKIQVLRQLQVEQERELAETKATLSANGFLFDSYGNLINSQEKLQSLAGWANEGDDERKEHVKDIEKMVDLYTDLANKSIPDTQDAIRDLQKDIRDTAIDQLTELREKLIDALKQERQQQKDAEISILDSRIADLRKQIDELDDEVSDRLTRRAKLEAELEKWKKDDSAFSTKKQQEIQKQLDELNKEIRKDELEKQIDEVEETKKTVEETYDAMLDDKQLYEDANNLISQGKTEEMLALLETYGEDYKNIGVLWGQNLSDAFMEEIKLALEALEYLKGESNKFTNDQPTNTTPPPSAPPSTPAPPPTTQKTIAIGSKVKVTDTSAGIYVDSYTSQSSGTWKGANVSTSDTMYVYNMRGDKVALARSQGGVPVGWIDKKKVKAFDTGGYTGDFQGGQLAMLHSKERVLSAQQTQSFEKLVAMLGDLVENPMLQLGQSTKSMGNPMTEINTNIEINNNFTVTNNTPFDQDRQDNNISQLMAKELRRFGKITKK